MFFLDWTPFFLLMKRMTPPTSPRGGLHSSIDEEGEGEGKRQRTNSHPEPIGFPSRSLDPAELSSRSHPAVPSGSTSIGSSTARPLGGQKPLSFDSLRRSRNSPALVPTLPSLDLVLLGPLFSLRSPSSVQALTSLRLDLISSHSSSSSALSSTDPDPDLSQCVSVLQSFFQPDDGIPPPT